MIFSVFGGRRLQLRYRGSCDGFEAAAFHSCCNGHPNTVTLIFGSFTPLTWSSQNCRVPDPSLRSFIFTIKNPHNLPPQIFKQKEAAQAIGDYRSYGPTFGAGSDLHVCGGCDSSSGSHSNLGTTYINNSGVQGKEVLTGACNFTVKELEVFEVV
jgi:hypothetical protein